MLWSKGLLFVWLSLPCTVSAVKCQTVCDLPAGAKHAIQRVSKHLLTSFGWVGKHLTTCTSWGRYYPQLSLGRTESCHDKRLCSTWQRWEKHWHLAVMQTNVQRALCPTSSDKHSRYVRLGLAEWFIGREDRMPSVQPSVQLSGQLSPLSYQFR